MTRSGCEIIVRHFQSEHDSLVLVARYLVFPALIAVFVGAPLLARELGTARAGLRGRR